MTYYVYFIIAVCLFVGELFTMEFSLTCLGIGALAAGVLSWLELGIWPQVVGFVIVSLLCWIGIRPIALRHFYKGTKNVKTPAEDVIGKEAVVETAIDPASQIGRVKVLGESWRATAAQAIPVGTKCLVEKLDGVTLTVRVK